MENTQTDRMGIPIKNTLSIEDVKKAKKHILDHLINSHDHMDFTEKDLLLNCLKSFNARIERHINLKEIKREAL